MGVPESNMFWAARRFPYALLPGNPAMQREKSVRSAMDYFAIPTERLARSARKESWIRQCRRSDGGKPIEFPANLLR